MREDVFTLWPIIWDGSLESIGSILSIIGGNKKFFVFFFLVSGELYLRVLQRPTADLEEVDAGLDEELDLAHRVLKVGGVVVRRVQLDADAEVGAHGLARLRDDVQDELGALFGGAAVGVCAAVGLDVALETVTLL